MKTGSSWVVARVEAKQPPWSTAMSTSTAPGRIVATMSSVTRVGALAPGTSTAPMTTSLSGSRVSISWVLEARVRMRLPNRRSASRSRAGFRSRTVTSAPMPTAMVAAFIPETPAPSTSTWAGRTPGTPPMSTPRPPAYRSRNRAAACGAIRPATSLIGASSGSERSGRVTVS